MCHNHRLWLSLLLLGPLAAACGAPQTVLPTPSLVAPIPLPPTEPLTPTGAQPTAAPTVTLRPSPTASSTPTARPPMAPTAATTPTGGAPVLLEERQIGAYTIRLWQPAWGTGLYNHATLSTAGQPEIRVEAVTAIGRLPAEDVTGDGFPDVLFETYAGGSHCCDGTVVYSLGPVPDKVLDLLAAPYYYGTGRGTFEDLDGDRVFEFLTRDPLAGIPCTAPTVKVVLQYVPGQGYVGASPRFPAVYAGEIAAHTQQAEQEIELSRDGYKCGVHELLLDYLYTGQTDRAWQELERLYLGPDREASWSQLQQAVREGRFYVAP